MRRLQLLLSASFALSGCATLSFAPPIVNQDRRLQFMRSQTFFGGVCDPTPVGRSNAVKPNVDGALLLINNYILTYRCQRDRAAEGRQFFEVPSLLGSAAAGTALALGAGPVVAIAAGAGNIALTHGKDYYAPQAKAQVLADGLQAMLCIQTEAVGVNPFVLQTVSDAQDVATGATTDAALDADKAAKRQAAQQQAEQLPKQQPKAPQTTDQTGSAAYISVSYGRQYYEMVRAALFSVEQAVGQRLSHSGTPFDAPGIIAEIEKLNQKEKDEAAAATGGTTGADDKTKTPEQKQKAKDEAEIKKGNDVKRAAGAVDNGAATAQGALGDLDARKVGQTIIKLDQLNTKLQKCVVAAKL